MASTLTIEEIRLEPVKQSGLNDLLNQLDLLIEAEDYDDDFQPPAKYAADKMHGFLEDVNDLLQIAFPLGTIYADGDGGLRLEWIRPDRELRLVISASLQGRTYFYHEQGDDYGADYAPTAGELSRWLNWLDSAVKVS
ncbi:MAG: hypothetical protein ACRYFS_23700 [Janthinobacterium lividum]